MRVRPTQLAIRWSLLRELVSEKLDFIGVAKCTIRSLAKGDTQISRHGMSWRLSYCAICWRGLDMSAMNGCSPAQVYRTFISFSVTRGEEWNRSGLLTNLRSMIQRRLLLRRRLQRRM